MFIFCCRTTHQAHKLLLDFTTDLSQRAVLGPFCCIYLPSVFIHYLTFLLHFSSVVLLYVLAPLFSSHCFAVHFRHISRTRPFFVECCDRAMHPAEVTVSSEWVTKKESVQIHPLLQTVPSDRKKGTGRSKLNLHLPHLNVNSRASFERAWTGFELRTNSTLDLATGVYSAVVEQSIWILWGAAEAERNKKHMSNTRVVVRPEEAGGPIPGSGVFILGVCVELWLPSSSPHTGLGLTGQKRGSCWECTADKTRWRGLSDWNGKGCSVQIIVSIWTDWDTFKQAFQYKLCQFNMC